MGPEEQRAAFEDAVREAQYWLNSQTAVSVAAPMAHAWATLALALKGDK